MGDESRRAVTRYEFDLFREGQHEWRAGMEERVRRLERLWDGHTDDRGEDDDEQAVEVRERRRWSWPEIIVAGITAAGVISAALVQALVH